MHKEYQKNLIVCKDNIKDQRQALTKEEWKIYLKKSYPNWHEDCYGESLFPS